MGAAEYDQASLTEEPFDVIIVGAGPVGLLTALNLGKAGVKTLVIEAHHELLTTTRAVVYMPVVLPVLEKLGMLDQIKEHAFLNKDGVRWRDIDGQVLAHLPIGSDAPDSFGGVLLIGQWRMNELILKELEKYPSVQVRFGLRCVGIQENEALSQIRVMTHTGSIVDDEKFFSARYLLAADGANSAVRRMSCIPFEGFTYQDFKMIGTDVLYDFSGNAGFDPLNFVVDSEDWAVIVYTGQNEHGQVSDIGKPQWRIAYAEPPDLDSSKEAYLERAQDRVKKYLSNKSDVFEVIRAEPYLMQQRVAAQPRKGRVLLAGDSLKSNNPIGGLGLTGGILDAFCYGNALRRVIVDGEPDQLVTECAMSRKSAWQQVTNELSQNNLQRLYSTDPAVITARESFFTKLNDTEHGKAFAVSVASSFGKMMPKTFERAIN